MVKQKESDVSGRRRRRSNGIEERRMPCSL
jgi:hypothetical protein